MPQLITIRAQPDRLARSLPAFGDTRSMATASTMIGGVTSRFPVAEQVRCLGGVGLVLLLIAGCSSPTPGSENTIEPESTSTTQPFGDGGIVDEEVLLEAIREAGVPAEGCVDDQSCIDFNEPSPGPVAVFVRLGDGILWTSAFGDTEAARIALTERSRRHPEATVERCGAVVVSIEPWDSGGGSQALDDERDYMQAILDAIEPTVGPC